MKAFVIEDEPRVASFIARVLKEEGFRVETCSSGVQALTRAARSAYDLLVVDWTLRDFDGLSIVRSLRKKGSNTPILMLTARRETSEKVLAFEAGVDDYLAKPFDVEELVARVQALVRRPRPAPSAGAVRRRGARPSA